MTAQTPKPEAGGSTPGPVGAVIVAAGRGLRAGGPVPKQYQTLAGRAVLARTVDRFLQLDEIAALIVVIAPGDEAPARAALSPLGPLTDRVHLVHGGDSRDASVAAGLAALPDPIARVLIHDGARPLVPEAVIRRVMQALDTAPGAAPALAVTDALWRGDQGQVAATHPRDGLWRAQTPQGFDLAAIRAAHAAHPGGAMDDVEVALAAGLDVSIVDGDADNIKLTVAEDFARAAQILKGSEQKGSEMMDIRLGNGFDVHRFGPGKSVMLCGVEIPHGRGLQGHSDADVGMHALTDAIYGALAEGDIGRHFPPSDPQWKGAASEIFLAHAVDLARARGFAISNLDCTLICEAPKIGPHAAAMQAALAAITGLEPGRISVKATTSEQLGFAGRKEGIAAIATATLVKS